MKRSSTAISRAGRGLTSWAVALAMYVAASAQILPTQDFGDAPSSYGTLAADNGPSHTVSALMFMGVLPTTERDADNSSGIAADDLDDGVVLPSFYWNKTATIPVAVFGSGKLQVWIDWNGDGDFLDAGEQVATNATDGGPSDADGLINGFIALAVPVPANTTTQRTFARFRWSSEADLGPVGPAPDGEVEDYAFFIIAPEDHVCETGSSLTGSGYASGGSGKYRDEIWWLDWSCGGKTFNPGDSVTKSWTLPGGIVVTARITGITEPLRPYVTGTGATDALDNLYSGVNPVGLSNAHLSLAPDFRIEWSATASGEAFPVDLVLADAQNTELVDLTTIVSDGSDWLPIEATGILAAAFPDILANTVIMGDLSPLLGGGTMLALSEGVSVTNVNVTADGYSSIAFGLFLPIDTGDAPSSYGAAGHSTRYEPDAFPILPEILGTGVLRLTDFLTVAEMEPASSLRLGNVPPDGDGSLQADTDALTDDQTGRDDEDGVTLPIMVPASTALIPVEVAGDGGLLQAWIDWNGDGDFLDAGEQIAVDAADGITDVTGRTDDQDTTEGRISISVSVPAGLTVGEKRTARFRWSSVEGLDAVSPAPDGEAEDYTFLLASGTAELTAEKSVQLFDGTTSTSPYTLPGEDVIYNIRIRNVGELPADNDSVLLIDMLPHEITFWNGDVDDGRADILPGTTPVAFVDAGSGLSFEYSRDVGFSDSDSRPENFSGCNYTPQAGYDPAVKFICFNPKGIMQTGSPIPEFTLSFRGRIR